MTAGFDRLVKFVQELVKIPSAPGQEEAVVSLLAREMQALGFDRVTTDENGSLIGSIEGAQLGPTLLFDAHCDTVGVAPGVPWRLDPFSATIEGGRMYGRGTSDMKGALAAMIHAAATADRSQMSGRVVVCASVMEEVMEGLALRAVMDEVQPAFVVIGESTDLKLNIGGRGRAEIHLTAVGKPAHSSAPDRGVNAALLMLEAVRAIDDISLGSDPLLGPAVMVLTDIISEPHPAHSVIPSLCRVTYDRRLLMEESEESVLSAIRDLPELKGMKAEIGHGEYRSYTNSLLQGPKFFPAWKVYPKHPFVQSALGALRSAGLKPEMGAYRFCTNAAYSAGMAKVPTVGFGPSTEDMAHIVDEYIELSHLSKATDGYRRIIEHVLT